MFQILLEQVLGKRQQMLIHQISWVNKLVIKQLVLMHQISLVMVLVMSATGASYSNFIGLILGKCNRAKELKFLWYGAGNGATEARTQISLVRMLVLNKNANNSNLLV
jgi:hypothetical protein